MAKNTSATAKPRNKTVKGLEKVLAEGNEKLAKIQAELEAKKALEATRMVAKQPMRDRYAEPKAQRQALTDDMAALKKEFNAKYDGEALEPRPKTSKAETADNAEAEAKPEA